MGRDVLNIELLLSEDGTVDEEYANEDDVGKYVGK